MREQLSMEHNGRVNDDDYGVGPLNAIESAVQRVGSEELFGLIREVSRVEARQVNELDLVLARFNLRSASLEGGAREVTGFCTQARKPIKERGLAAVGVAN